MEVPLGSEFEEGVEQADGIGAARNGDTDLLGRLEHAVAGDGVCDALEQGEYHLYRGSRCGPAVAISPVFIIAHNRSCEASP